MKEKEERLYDLYALDEDIKICEEIKEMTLKACECGLSSGSEKCKWRKEAEAIEHLIEAYRKVREENDRVDYTSVYLNGVYDGEDKWKSKIKEKIEEYNTQREKTHKHDEYHMFVNYIDVLQELLEEE